ncbi:MAG TPA: hypothetical protein VL550_05825 [Rhodocyclaceae bacterium]|nr:hypothetical protein [Rhodocyclaceae bacterium]
MQFAYSGDSPLRLTDRFNRFAVYGGQLTLLMVGFHIRDPRGWFGIALGITALSVFGWTGALRRWRSIKDTPTSQVASAAQGYVEVAGWGKPLEGLPLLSPLTGAPCLWYRYTVEEKSGTKWEHRRGETSDASFIIRDASGECLVDPEGAEVLTTSKNSWEDGGERYTQWLLRAEERIHVLGNFTTRSSLTLQLDRNADISDLLAEWKRDHPQLLKRFDLDGDGQISLKEWELARSAARREIEAKHREVRSAPDLHVIHYPDGGQPYIISSIRLDKLAGRYMWWAWGHLAVFFGGIAGAVYAFRLAF